jgi:hypothetical protein
VANNPAVITLTAVDNVTRVVKGITNSLEGLAAPVAALQALGAAAGLTAFVRGLVQAVKAIDDLSDSAEGLGVTAVQLAELRAAGQQAGLGLEQVDKLLTSVNLKISAAAGGNKDAIDFFNRLGIAFQEAGKARSGLVVLGEFSDKFKTFENNAAKAALGAELAGEKLGPKAAALLNQGSDALRVYVGQTDKLTEEGIRLNRQFDELSVSITRLKNELLGGLLPALNAAFSAGKDTNFLRDPRIVALDFILKLVRELKKETSDPAFQEAFKPIKDASGLPIFIRPPEYKPQAPTAQSPDALRKLAEFEKLAAEARREFQQSGLRATLDEEAAAGKRAAGALAEYNRQAELAAQILEDDRQEGLRANREREDRDAARARAQVEAFNRELEESKKLGQDLGLVFESAVSRLFTDGDLTARNFFKALGDDIAQTITKILIMEPLLKRLRELLTSGGSGGQGIGGLFSGLLQLLPGRAMGGPVFAGSPYVVGERGPELFVPSVSGQIVPSGGGMGGVTIVQNNSIDARSDIATIRAMLENNKAATVREVGNQLARRGALARV